MGNRLIVVIALMAVVTAGAKIQAEPGRVAKRGEEDVPSAKGSDLMLKRSDVVLSYPGADIDAWKNYGVTVWGWGPEPAWVDNCELKVREAFDAGMRIVSTCISACILPPPHTEFGKEFRANRELLETWGINIEGEPIITPFWPTDYGDGTHGWWYCTNNPTFVENVRKRVRLGMSTGANAFQMDVAHGTAVMLDTGAAGCFCKWCHAGFRQHLKGKYSAEDLSKLGIDDIERFDYRLLVKEVASTVEEFNRLYRSNIGKLPLIEDFMEYQFSAGAAFIKEMTTLAREVAGPAILTSGNVGSVGPRYLMGTDNYDHLVVEVPHYMRPGHMAVLPYKLADALGKPLALWPVVGVRHVQQNNLTGLLKIWIANSYAFGGNMMIPERLWMGTDSANVNLYQADPDDYVPLYNFVRQNADLFDDYETVEQVGLLYSNRALRKRNREVENVCWRLLNANIPFGLALAGDEYLNIVYEYVLHM